MEHQPRLQPLLGSLFFNIEADLELEGFMSREGEKDMREMQESVQTKFEEDILSYELVLFGFNLDNQNLMCVQLVNALQAQLEILESAIFKTCGEQIYNFGVGFLPSEYGYDRASNSHIEVKCEPDVQATEFWSVKSKQVSVIEGETEFLMRQEWEKVSERDKMEYLYLRREVDRLKKVITETLSCRAGKEHICLLCGAEFLSGRQLGGHMSRRHPGNSLDYSKKRQLHFTKTVERERRKYFKDIKKDPAPKAKPISKSNHTAMP